MIKRVNLGKVFFLYLMGVLFLQIIGFSAKGGFIDTAWKVFVLCSTLLYIRKNCGRIPLSSTLLLGTVYLVSQIIAVVSSNFGNYFSSFTNIAVIFAMYYMFDVVTESYVYFDLRDFLWYINAYIVFMLFAVVISLIKNPSAVFGVFSNSSVYMNMLKGFFDNKQTFGMFLFLTVVLSIFGYTMTHYKRYVFCIVIFSIWLFICLSRTALVACLVFILLTIVFQFNENRKISMILILFVLVGVVVFKNNSVVNTFFQNVVLDTDSTMNARYSVWDYSFQALKGLHILVGYGEGNVASALLTVTANSLNSHNGFIQIMLTGGCIKLLLYISVVFSSLKTVREMKKYNRALSNLFFTSIVSILVYSMGEALVLFDTSSPCVVATTLCVGFLNCCINYYRLREDVV